MYEKSDLKTMLDVYLGFEEKEKFRKKIKFLMDVLGYEAVEEFLKDEKYITEAVKLKDLELTKLLYTNGSIIPTSLLKIAIDNNDVDMLNFLLDVGIDVNKPIENCEPIAYLIQKQNIQTLDKDYFYNIIEKMLKLGANPNAKIGYYSIVEYYLKNANFVYNGELKLISLFLKNGATIDSKYKNDLYIITLKDILTENKELRHFYLNQTIEKNDTMEILNIILEFDIPKYLLNAEIKHLRKIKFRINQTKYKQMLSALRKAKRKTNV